MKNSDKKRNRNFILLIIWIIELVLFSIILVHHFSYRDMNRYSESLWNVLELILSSFGTIVLGVIAIYQSRDANDLSKKTAEVEDAMYKLEIQPFIMVIDWKVTSFTEGEILCKHSKDRYYRIGDYQSDDTILGLVLQLENTTPAFLIADFSEGWSNSTRWEKGGGNQPNQKFYLHSGDKAEIIFYAKKDLILTLKGESYTLRFILENRFADRFEETFNLKVPVLEEQKDKSYYCVCNIQQYTINKCKSKEKLD